ncbi:MAG TPA: hypothetical protein VG273_17985 [Bryobacteraceae bacterium]|nr:hypothetical protein [Bryobacteraceae bacterium]
MDVARPLVQRVVRARFFSARDTAAEDQEDVCSGAIEAILVRVKALLSTPDSPQIDNFEAFAAGVASFTASRFFMNRTPQRTLLRNRIRYVLKTDGRFRIRQDESGHWLCGLAAAKLAKVRGTLAEVILTALAAAGGEMELGTLTSTAADSLGISDRRETVDDVAGILRAPGPGADRQAETRERVVALWREVCELPVGQRRALLLNLGASGTWMIPDLGIATFRELAGKLEMKPEELAAIWNRLPLADNEIAERFGLTRQQVINLRSAGRQRLARKLETRRLETGRLAI